MCLMRIDVRHTILQRQSKSGVDRGLRFSFQWLYFWYEDRHLHPR